MTIRKILVTGGAGFIGSNFIRFVLSEHEERQVVNLDKLTYAGNPANLEDVSGDSRYRFIQGDICDSDVVRDCMKGVDAVVHFAAESHVDNSIRDPNEFQRTNVLGTLTLLNAAREAGLKKFIHVSTDEVYGSIQEGSFHEDSPLRPNSPYSASKAASDLFARSYHVTYDLPVVITRSSNNFGPSQYPEKVIPLFVTNLIEGTKVPLYGDGLNVRDWIHVEDNCRAIDLVLEKGIPGEIYNIGGGNEVNNLELTRSILSLSGCDESMIEYVTDRPGHDRRYSLSSEKVRGLGWRPGDDFSKDLERTIEWYRAHPEWWKPLKHAGRTS